MYILILSQLRHHIQHRLQTLLAILGVALGVAVVNAVDITQHSAIQNLHKTQQYINAQANHRIVGASETIDELHYKKLRSKLLSQYPQITLTPILKLPLLPITENQKKWIIMGIDPLTNRSLIQIATSNQNSVTSQFFSKNNAAIISSELAAQKSVLLGETMTLPVSNKSLTLSITGIIDSQRSINSNLIVMDIGNAQTVLNKQGKLTSIDINIPNHQLHLVNVIKQYLPQNTHLIETKTLVEGQLSLINALGFNLSALSFLSLVVGAFLIFSTVRFSILQRLPSFARLRVLGVTHQELHQLLILESLFLSALGLLLGWGLGYVLSLQLAPITQQTMTDIYSIQVSSTINIDISIYIKTALLGTITTFVSYYLSYKSNKEIDLSHTIARIQQEMPHKNKKAITQQVIFAFIFFSSALLLQYFPIEQSINSTEKNLWVSYLITGMLTLSAVLIIPISLYVIYPVILKIAYFSWGVIGLIALRDCQRENSRVLLAIIALCLSIAATNGIAIMIDSFRYSVTQWIDSQLNADIYLRMQSPQSELETNKIIKQLQNDPAIQCVSLSRQTTTLIDNKWLPINARNFPSCAKNPIQLISTINNFQLSRFGKNQLLVSESLAQKRQLRINDNFTLLTEMGDRQFKIAGIFRDYGSEHGRIIMPLKHFQALWNDYIINNIGIYLNSASVKKHYLEQLNKSLPNNPAIQIIDSNTVRSIVMQIFDQTFETTKVLRIIVIIIAIISIISTLVIYQLQRREQLLTLRAIGITTYELRQLFVLQACFIGGIAGIFAVPLGLLIAWLLTHIINPAAFGWTLTFYFNPTIVASGVVIALSAGLLAAIYPCLHFNSNTNITELGRE